LTKIWKYKLTINKFLFFFPSPPAHVFLIVINTDRLGIPFSEFIGLQSFGIFTLLAYLLFLSILISKCFPLIPPVFILIHYCIFSSLFLLFLKHLWWRNTLNLILGIKWLIFILIVHYYNVFLILKCVFLFFVTKWLF
jgi:hypothetical protein